MGTCGHDIRKIINTYESLEGRNVRDLLEDKAEGESIILKRIG
jgi:hypothetical protein